MGLVLLLLFWCNGHFREGATIINLPLIPMLPWHYMFGLISQSNLRGIFLTHPLAFTFLGKSSPANLTYVFNQIEINDFSFLSKDSLIFHRPKPVLDKKSKSVFLCTNGLLNGSSFLLNFNEG